MPVRSQKFPVSALASTTANQAATRKVMIGTLPGDGAWSFNARVLAVDPSAGRPTTHMVQFNVNASGVCVGGTPSETDGISGGSAWPTQPTSNPFTGTLVTVVLNSGSPPTAELELTGATIDGGVAADWAVEGELIILSAETAD
jgi:hypothetical protein